MKEIFFYKIKPHVECWNSFLLLSTLEQALLLSYNKIILFSVLQIVI